MKFRTAPSLSYELNLVIFMHEYNHTKPTSEDRLFFLILRFLQSISKLFTLLSQVLKVVLLAPGLLFPLMFY